MGTTSARFNTLGELAGTLAESAGLRIRVVQVYEGSAPHLDVQLAAAPDLSSWAAFGTPAEGGPWMLSSEWRYRLAIPTVNAALSAAGGQGADRILTSAEDQDSQDLWHARVEQLVDQRDTTDLSEIANGLADELETGAGPTEISVPIGRAPGIGTVVPIGAKVAATLDGEVIVERIRQATTELKRNTGDPTLRTTAVLGTPDVGVQSPTQRKLADALRRVKRQERQ